MFAELKDKKFVAAAAPDQSTRNFIPYLFDFGIFAISYLHLFPSFVHSFRTHCECVSSSHSCRLCLCLLELYDNPIMFIFITLIALTLLRVLLLMPFIEIPLTAGHFLLTHTSLLSLSSRKVIQVSAK
jgi:hypothetical protein